MPIKSLEDYTDAEINELNTIITSLRAVDETVLRNFLNKFNDKGQPPLHSLMRKGAQNLNLKLLLVTIPELDVNLRERYTEPGTGKTIAELCENPAIMRFLAKREDFKPNLVSPYTGQTALEFAITYAKRPAITVELLKCRRLDIDKEKIRSLSAEYKHANSRASIVLIMQELESRRAATAAPASVTPNYDRQKTSSAPMQATTAVSEKETAGNTCRPS